ncbi:hypothetical protein KY321_00755, partial [Candidatus Woesearchaeota archaeon]|nr:hypothetical protein [Candidatus Woesearchaeota archaeon]
MVKKAKGFYCYHKGNDIMAVFTSNFFHTGFKFVGSRIPKGVKLKSKHEDPNYSFPWSTFNVDGAD